MGDVMNDLLEKFQEYKSIVNYKMKYLLENGLEVEFKLKQTDFPHLIGLHKLVDIPLIRKFNDKNNKTVSAKYIIAKIKKQNILTGELIRKSHYYSDIEERYSQFTRDNLLTVSYTDAVINFDASLIGSKLSADYILFENKMDGINHLCVAKSSNGQRYAESYFHNSTDLYIRNQQIVKVKQVVIYDAKGKLYLQDDLSY